MKSLFILLICSFLIMINSNVAGNHFLSAGNSSLDIMTFTSPSDTLPVDFPKINITQNGEPAAGYLFGSSNSGVDSIGSYFMILNNDGDPLFHSQSQSAGRLLSNGYFATPVPLGPKHQYIWYIKDQSFNIVDSFQMGNGYIADNHDFTILPNGHAIMLAYDIQYIDMSKIVEGGHPNAKITGSIIQELDVDKNVVYQWRCWDHIPIIDSYKNITKSGFDYIHVNSLELDNDGHIILSCRETSEVLKISRETGETIWRWGGKNNDFTTLGDHEENAPRYFKVQHSVRRVSNGNIIMFDNGADKNDLEREYTRAVEYDLDEEAMTATMTWEYRHDPDILALSGGTVVRFPNGNTSINWGGASREGAPPYTEAGPDGELVYEITYDSPDVTGNFSRFLWFDLAPRDTVTVIEIAETNTYEFKEGDSIVTGISLKINSYTGDGYNEVTVMREKYGPLYPEFTGRAPMVFAERINVSGFAITSINADMIFDLDEFNFTDPDSLVIYYREFPGTGLFLPLETQYNNVTNTLKATIETFGEFIVGKADFKSAKHPPMLITPEDKGYVNYSLPVNLLWTPIGFVNEFSIQVANDSLFTDLLMDEENLKETSISMESLENNSTYYWRVLSVNDAGVSDWSDMGRFSTTSPSITVNIPDGSESWQVGLEYMIRWDDNLNENVILELYKNDEPLAVLDTVSSDGYYDWEIDPDLTPDADYKIRITSIDADTVFDINLEPFTLMDTTNTSVPGTVEAKNEDLLQQNYPNPFNSSTTIIYKMIKNELVSVIVYDAFGREVKTLVNDLQPSGTYSITFNAAEFTNGIYFLKMNTPSFSQVRKMILIK